MGKASFFARKVVLGIMLSSMLFAPVSGHATPRGELNVGAPTFGFDMELDDRTLQWLVPYFDLDQTEAILRTPHTILPKPDWFGVMNSYVTSDYVLNREAFYALPLGVQNELSQGLDIESRVNLITTAQPLLNAEGQPISQTAPQGLIVEKPKLVLPNQDQPHTLGGLILPNAPTPELRPSLQGIGQDERVRSDWSVLNTRWNNLPAERRADLVHMRYLSGLKAARAISKIPLDRAAGDTLGRKLPLKANAPEWLERLTRTFDLPADHRFDAGTVELALDGTERSQPVMRALINQLMSTLMLNGLMRDPLRQRRMDIAFHWHVSFDDLQRTALESNVEANAEFDRRLKLYRVLMLTRILAAGPHNDAVLREPSQDTVDINIYDLHISDKGILRRVEPGHAEIRDMTKSPIEVMNEFVEFMQITKNADFDTRVREEVLNEIRRHPDIIERIESRNLFVLVDFAGLVDPRIIVSRYMNLFSRSLPGSREEMIAYRSLAMILPHQSAIDALKRVALQRPFPIEQLTSIFPATNEGRLAYYYATLMAPEIFNLDEDGYADLELKEVSKSPKTRALAAQISRYARPRESMPRSCEGSFR